MAPEATLQQLAPIALFAYRRPQHTRRAVESLLCNPEAERTELVIYSDAAAHPGAAADVAAVRAYLRTITGFARVTLVERQSNQGLSRSIIGGVGELLGTYGRVIVVEDDLVVSPFFLAYMNEGLRRYADDPRVASIHGYMYPVDGRVALPEAFFLQGADCWGWATWSHAWQHFEPDGRKLAAELRRRGCIRAFDLDGRYPFFRMLRHQIVGKNDSWAIRWHASAFLAGMLTLYPGRSHVLNTGADGSGTHSKTNVSLGEALARSATEWSDFPVQVHEQARGAIGDYLRGLRRRVWIGRLRRLLPRAGQGS